MSYMNYFKVVFCYIIFHILDKPRFSAAFSADHACQTNKRDSAKIITFTVLILLRSTYRAVEGRRLSGRRGGGVYIPVHPVSDMLTCIGWHWSHWRPATPGLQRHCPLRASHVRVVVLSASVPTTSQSHAACNAPPSAPYFNTAVRQVVMKNEVHDFCNLLYVLSFYSLVFNS